MVLQFILLLPEPIDSNLQEGQNDEKTCYLLWGKREMCAARHLSFPSDVLQPVSEVSFGNFVNA